jgi:hypothetical protein
MSIFQIFTKKLSAIAEPQAAKVPVETPKQVQVPQKDPKLEKKVIEGASIEALKLVKSF